MSVSRFFRRRRWDEERDRELAAYLEIETAENVARGMSAEEARAGAHRKLGNATLVREEIYRMNSFGFIETRWQGNRACARLLRKHPGFTALPLVTLSLGIGANPARLHLVDWLVLQPHPRQESRERDYPRLSEGGALTNDIRMSYREFQQIRQQA